MEPLLIDEVTVSMDDLVMIRAALNSAYHQNAVFDLLDGYRKLSNRPTPSKLSQAVKHALTLVEAYIAIAPDAEATADE